MGQPPSSRTPGRTVVVIPCYNEAERLDINAFRDYKAAGNPQVEFIFVNDGSTDATLAVLERLVTELGGANRVINLSPNRGKSEAVRQGIVAALSENPQVVGFWDADLATPLDAIGELGGILAEASLIEMVFGARVALLGRKIVRRGRRHYSGRVFSTVVSMVLRLPIYDTQCGAKLFRVTSHLPTLFEQPFRSRWVFDVEIIARRIRVSRTVEAPPVEDVIYEFPLKRWTDVPGSKLVMGDFFRAIWDVAGIWWNYLV